MSDECSKIAGGPVTSVRAVGLRIQRPRCVITVIGLAKSDSVLCVLVPQRLPLTRQHRINDVIDEAIVQPARFTKRAFALKSESLRDRAAALISGGAMNLEAIHPI